MSKYSRRDFLKSTVAAGAIAGVGGLTIPSAATAAPAARKATDFVTLGNSGVKVTRLAFGTGTYGGRVQRELGQEQFNRLVRHAYDSGIRFFETAEAYTGMPEMLGIALKGIPRDSYALMTKYRLRSTDDPKTKIDAYRKTLNSEYFDILLLHCVRSAEWAEQFKPIRDEFDNAKQKKIISAHGASVHGLIPLRTFPANDWLDVALMRVNHKGTRMDTLKNAENEDLGDVSEVMSHVKKVHARGVGVLGMKLVGEGRFTTPEDREAAMRFVMGSGAVDAVTIGFKSPAEIDEAIERMNRSLKA